MGTKGNAFSIGNEDGTKYGIPLDKWNKMDTRHQQHYADNFEDKISRYAREKLAKAAGIDPIIKNGREYWTAQMRMGDISEINRSQINTSGL